ncbi:unnamed protein product, partial [Discosporangium mesarthrocarpum]
MSSQQTSSPQKSRVQMDKPALPQESREVASAREKDAGNAAYKAGKAGVALRHYTKAIELNPSNHILHSNQSMALGALGRWKLSEQAAARTVELSPSFLKGYFRLAKAQLEQGQANKAYATAAQGMCVDLDRHQGGEGVLSLGGKELSRLADTAKEHLREGSGPVEVASIPGPSSSGTGTDTITDPGASPSASPDPNLDRNPNPDPNPEGAGTLTQPTLGKGSGGGGLGV